MADISKDNAKGWKIVLKINSSPLSKLENFEDNL